MKFKEYLSNLQKLAESKPETLDMVVVSSSDEEGNFFSEVMFEPQLGFYDERSGEFDVDSGVAAVCIN